MERIEADADNAVTCRSWNDFWLNEGMATFVADAYKEHRIGLHLLRAEMGDEPFWRGIRAFTRAYVGQSVTTPDFKRAMERSAGRDLSAFFAKWVYARQPLARPSRSLFGQPPANGLSSRPKN